MKKPVIAVVTRAAMRLRGQDTRSGRRPQQAVEFQSESGDVYVEMTEQEPDHLREAVKLPPRDVLPDAAMRPVLRFLQFEAYVSRFEVLDN